MCRAADAAGHADVDRIVPGCKRLSQRFEKTGDVDHGGRHGRAAAHCVIVGLAVKVHSRVLMRLDTIDQVGQRDHAQGIFLNVRGRQVRRRIGKDLNHMGAPLFCSKCCTLCALYPYTRGCANSTYCHFFLSTFHFFSLYAKICVSTAV